MNLSDTRICVLWISFVFVSISCTVDSLGVNVKPGTGLTRTRGGSSIPPCRVVIFEHEAAEGTGTGGLVINQATPLHLSDLAIPRFRIFGDNALMMGCGMHTDFDSNIVIADMSPWFWLHNVEELSGSSPLLAADGPLFLGGNIEQATDLIESGKIESNQFKFFYKYLRWEANELNEEIEQGLWTDIGPMDPKEALEPFSFKIFP